MCGIAGTVNCGDESILKRMTASVTHRGPDDADIRFFQEEQVGLGHRRLSIIDLSNAGRQPMSNDDGSLWITFNGEIYNFKQLRAMLERKGHRFRSQTDTEVILRLYEDEGIGCVARLNGMFAFGLLDRKEGKLYLVRDHLGVKPLYYYHAQGKLVFGSEIKAILASNEYSPEINWQGFYDYLTYLYVPCPETMFRGIHQIPPAHVLEFNLKNNQAELSRYWFPENQEHNGNGNSSNEFGSALRELLTDSVQGQMMSDVPLGVFLSGGVDSPILTGLMAEASSAPVKSFTVTFTGKDIEFYNESETARAAANKFSTDHHEIPVDISSPTEMLRLVEFFDQPFGNPTFYLMYLISKATRAHATVALCGAGGDELFAGYPRYRAMRLAEWCKHLPGPVTGAAKGALSLVSDDYRTATLRRARQFLGGLDKDFARQFVNWTYFLNEPQKRELLGSRFDENGNNHFQMSERVVRRVLDRSAQKDFGNRVLEMDVQTFLPDNILEYTDKMSMAASLEVRVPYLDHRLVEHALRIPFNQKLKRGKAKAILKETFRDLLPAGNAKAPKKGFNFPLAVWMRDYLDSYFDRFMGREEVVRHGIFNWETIQLMRQEHRSGKSDNSYPLFAIIMFDVWYRWRMLGQDLSELVN